MQVLRQYELDWCAQKLVEDGYINREFWKDIDEEELKEYGIKKGWLVSWKKMLASMSTPAPATDAMDCSSTSTSGAPPPSPLTQEQTDNTIADINCFLHTLDLHKHFLFKNS